ncbi:serine/threonine-protein kinase pim-1-like [Brachyistius frenatus]|uniref:serine/threonine-protein kinase pim-1-like n=1 Tax=Brachyistius frenatus TaxID=100188 RepID=UPI0037E718A4
MASLKTLQIAGAVLWYTVQHLQRVPGPKEGARVSVSDGKANPEKICQSKWRRVREKRKVRKDKNGLVTTKEDLQTLPFDDNEMRCKPLEDCSTSSGTAPCRKRVRSQYRRAEAELGNKYIQEELLGEGGCGSVFAGCRKADSLPVAIKHVMKRNVFCKIMGEDGKQISVEIAVMQKLAEEKAGTSGAPVALLDWYDLGRELILVMERPIPSVDLYHYIEASGGALPEEESKVIVQQLLNALKEMEDTKIFHRDIKTENILIQTVSSFPRVRIIDFGLSCFTGKETQFRRCFGTPDHVTPEFCRRGTYSSGSCTVWQLGIVLFEMLNRGKTFETGMFLTNKIKITKRITRNCHNFLTSCLAKNPKDRPSLEDLQQHPWIR